MPINAKLVVVGGEVKTAEIKLRLPCTIGRGRGCTIMLPQALVSRQHCELFESSGKLMVRDLGSLNGTFVNNQKIAEASPVNSEELLSIGTVTFRVVYEGAGASSPPAGPGPVMKSSANETLPAVGAAAAAPAEAPINSDDSSQPLEIGEFDFEETVRPSSDTVSPAPLPMPVISVGEPAKKPAAVAPVPKPVAASAKPIAPIPVPAPAAAAKPIPVPAAKPVVPAAAAAPAAAKSPDAPETEEAVEAEDDFQDFLKSLGK
ncbi:MAG: FHA domain-containing protein [Pirellulaceae bacterium]|nr:FHA domain-containing protein [Pirellulaceae bacterium]